MSISVSPLSPQAALDPEQNFLICALDTLSGVVEALGPNIEPLVSRSSARDIVLQCCQVSYCVLPFYVNP